MAQCDRCHGDNLAWRKRDKPVGRNMDLHWLCDACFTGLPPAPEAKRHGFSFWRRVTYQIVIPVMTALFILIELGLHL